MEGRSGGRAVVGGVRIVGAVVGPHLRRKVFAQGALFPVAPVEKASPLVEVAAVRLGAFRVAELVCGHTKCYGPTERVPQRARCLCCHRMELDRRTVWLDRDGADAATGEEGSPFGGKPD